MMRPSKNPLPRTAPRFAGLLKLLSGRTSDLSLAVVGAAVLDERLAWRLRTKLAQSRVTEKLLDQGRGPIGSFGARADLAYALGLLPKLVYQDLLTIATIRNSFAHSPKTLRFTSAEIVRLCTTLKYADSVSDRSSSSDPTSEPPPAVTLKPRHNFERAVIMTYAGI